MKAKQTILKASIKSKFYTGSLFLLIFVFILQGVNLNIYAQDISDNFNREDAIEKLLALGMTYGEIYGMTDEEMEIFYYSNNISMDTKYLYVPENECETPVLVEKEEVFKAIFEKNKNDCFFSKPISVFNNAALAISSATDTKVSSGGYLEQTVYIADTIGSEEKYYISYRARWLIQPLNRKVDVFGVVVSNATVVPNSATASYKWVIDRYYKGNYQPEWASDTVNLNGNLKYDSQGVATKVKLMTDTIDNVQKVVTQNMYLSFYVTRDNVDIKTIGVAGNYLHQEAAIGISPSITAVSFSLGISVSNSEKFTVMTPNPYTVLYI